MSITRRIIDLAKSNINLLLERAADTADPRRRLSNIPDAELEAELARRRAARLTEQKVADAKARVDSAGAGAKPPPDRAERERVAREREARVRAAREGRAREAAQQQAARERAQASYRSQSSSSSSGRGSSQSQGSSSRARPGTGAGARPRGHDPELKRYYDRLELPYGSDWDAVRTSYRKLMRKYHPDLHGGKSPEKLRAATEVAQALTQAYNELEKHLLGGPNRK